MCTFNKYDIIDRVKEYILLRSKTQNYDEELCKLVLYLNTI